MAVEKEKASAMETVESLETVSPQAIQQRFSTLASLDDEQMAALHKRMLRRIDWRLMPTITIMFLMKYVQRVPVSRFVLLTAA